MLDFETEFALGKHDATRDIEKHGLKYALYLLEGQDPEDPYIQGYMFVTNQAH